MSKKIAIVNTHSPFNTPVAKESLDIALIFGAFDQQVSVFFIENGIYQLLKDQQPELIDSKDFLSTMKALELYDIEEIICCSDSVKERQISPEKIAGWSSQQTRQQIAQLLNEFDHVVMQ